uniref:Uncharacterized protein n=1 Tax=Trypanosoma congolense (strain IL3000) TaxID=1068625 RepID=G0UPX0_TRYCI|nr:hypothetical protein, unlikely [Trypanosoma congolense IL3000]
MLAFPWYTIHLPNRPTSGPSTDVLWTSGLKGTFLPGRSFTTSTSKLMTNAPATRSIGPRGLTCANERRDTQGGIERDGEAEAGGDFSAVSSKPCRLSNLGRPHHRCSERCGLNALPHSWVAIISRGHCLP